MNINFPEYLFVPTYNYYAYNQGVDRGKKIAANSTILFCGVVRNADQYLERNILRITRTASIFKDYGVFIYENDSEDDTKEILKKYNHDKIIAICEDGIKNDYLNDMKSGKDINHAKRAASIANCRNNYMKYINDHNYDYVCVLDLDLRGGWSYDGFYNSIDILKRLQDVACVSAYGILSDYHNTINLENILQSNYIMYDSFAFRPFGFDKPLSANVQSSFNFFKVNRGDDPLLVHSNFNGMAIYKHRYIKNKYYDIRINENNYVDCDHVIMHEQIRKDGGKILLNPNLIVSYSHHKYSQI